MKRSRVLETEVEADVPYDETRLAKDAKSARPRLGILLLVGAGGALLEAGITRSPWWLVAVAALAAIAWAVHQARLSGAIAAAFVAVVAALVALVFAFAADDIGRRVLLGFVVVWALAMLPPVITLLRDFELQHAYGLWARR